MSGVFISQKMDLMEVIGGCEMPNKYFVSPLAPGGGIGGPNMFKCKENSNCC